MQKLYINCWLWLNNLFALGDLKICKVIQHKIENLKSQSTYTLACNETLVEFQEKTVEYFQ